MGGTFGGDYPLPFLSGQAANGILVDELWNWFSYNPDETKEDEERLCSAELHKATVTECSMRNACWVA